MNNKLKGCSSHDCRLFHDLSLKEQLKEFETGVVNKKVLIE
jgi:hypothetical protein